MKITLSIMKVIVGANAAWGSYNIIGAGHGMTKMMIGKRARYVAKEGGTFLQYDFFSTGTKENSTAWPPDILDTRH